MAGQLQPADRLLRPLTGGVGLAADPGTLTVAPLARCCARSSTDRASDYGSEGLGVRIPPGARLVETAQRPRPDEDGAAPFSALGPGGGIGSPGTAHPRVGVRGAGEREDR